MLEVKAQLWERVGADLGEGPQLFHDGSIRWVDLLGGLVYRKRGDDSVLEHSFPYEVSKVLPWQEGFIALTRQGIELHDSNSDKVSRIPLPSSHIQGRCSDGTVLPDGSLALGIVDCHLRSGAGALVSVGIDCEVRDVIRNCSIPNGIATLASQDSVVWTDSATNILTLFQWTPARGLHSPREWVHIPLSMGKPDGLVADSTGGVWVALWGGGSVVHVSHRGTIDTVIDAGTPYPTAIAFDAEDNLVITSAAIIFRENKEPVPFGAGDLWRLEASQHGTHGIPPVLSRLTIQEALDLAHARKCQAKTDNN
jgi:sugar lactone lactonase YvrE